MTFARIRALILVGVLFVTAAVVVVMAMTRDSQTKPSIAAQCPAGAVPASLELPERNQVKLNIYNGSKQFGVAQKVGTELKNRDFKILKVQNAPGKRTYDEIAIIRYGPKTVGAAQLMAAYFLGEAKMNFDIKRTDDVVDIYLGIQFQQLATTTEVNQSIAVLGKPPLPPGTCDAAG